MSNQIQLTAQPGMTYEIEAALLVKGQLFKPGSQPDVRLVIQWSDGFDGWILFDITRPMVYRLARNAETVTRLLNEAIAASLAIWVHVPGVLTPMALIPSYASQIKGYTPRGPELIG